MFEVPICVLEILLFRAGNLEIELVPGHNVPGKRGVPGRVKINSNTTSGDLVHGYDTVIRLFKPYPFSISRQVVFGDGAVLRTAGMKGPKENTTIPPVSGDLIPGQEHVHRGTECLR